MAIENVGNHESSLKISRENFDLLLSLVLQARALSYVSLSFHFQESASEVIDAYLGVLNNLIENIVNIVTDIKK